MFVCYTYTRLTLITAITGFFLCKQLGTVTLLGAFGALLYVDTYDHLTLVLALVSFLCVFQREHLRTVCVWLNVSVRICISIQLTLVVGFLRHSSPFSVRAR